VGVGKYSRSLSCFVKNSLREAIFHFGFNCGKRKIGESVRRLNVSFSSLQQHWRMEAYNPLFQFLTIKFTTSFHKFHVEGFHFNIFLHIMRQAVEQTLFHSNIYVCGNKNSFSRKFLFNFIFICENFSHKILWNLKRS
jgi:hypothetical protein